MAQVIVQHGDKRGLIKLPPSLEGLILVARTCLSIPMSEALRPRYFHGPTEQGIHLTEANYKIIRDCSVIGLDLHTAEAARGLVNQHDRAFQEAAHQSGPQSPAQIVAVASVITEIEQLWIVCR